MHYASPEKWAALLAKKEGKGNTPLNVYYNEVCGESYDTGSRLVTLSELQAAATLPHSNNLEAAVRYCNSTGYVYRILAVDWGGGGEDGISYTKYAVLGIKPDGHIECIYGYQSLTPHDHLREARIALMFLSKFRCHAMAHDYTGAGSLRETFVVHAGFPLERVVAVAYQRAAAGHVMQFMPAGEINPRAYYRVDKSRSLLLTCNHIKHRWLTFFKDDYEDADNPGLLRDFLALVDQKTDSRLGRDIYTITRDPSKSDDFAQAVNIGCCTLWHMTQKWPNIAEMAAMQVSQELLNSIHPPANMEVDL
jgi:hypothetical protein